MIIFPMAGLSSRFSKAGYLKPKYMLEAHGKTIFEWAVSSFQYYFKTETFLFIAMDTDEVKDFIENKTTELGIVNYKIALLNAPTKGQAETVYQGLTQLSNVSLEKEHLFIFNIDTILLNYKFPDFLNEALGYLDVFIGEGENWSYAKPKKNSKHIVEKTAEKNQISNLCSNGLYYFKSFEIYENAFLEMTRNNLTSKGEFYIAPMYNLLTKTNKIFYNITSSDFIVFCGIPEEYDAFKKSSIPLLHSL